MVSSWANKSDIDDFIDGQLDCRNGEVARLPDNDHYMRGYRLQYHIEQSNTEKNLKQENEE